MWPRAAAAWVALALGLAVGVGVLGVAPAGAATQVTLSPASGPPGTSFVVTGTGFAALPVGIRWGGLTGPVIATATGPAFSVTAVVPESPPNSHPVMAVVTDGSSVSTSSASFQVTAGEAPAPAETTTTTGVTTTTVAAPEPSPTASIPAGSGGPAIQSGSPRGGLSGGVDGGIETGMAETTSGGGAPGASSTGGGGGASTAPSTATTVASSEPPPPTVTLPAAAAPGPAPIGDGVASAPQLAGDGVAAPALVPRPTSQSAGAVRNPALLFLGLALVFGGGVFLAVRNRHRA